MSAILEALASIATAAATEAAARNARRIVWGGAAVLCLLVGFVFAASAGYEALVVAVGSLAAKLMLAGVFLIVGLIILVVLQIRKSQRRQQAKESGPTTALAVAFAMGLLSGFGRRK